MLNKVNLVGRLTRDPEIRYSADNQLAVTRFTLAVGRRFKRDNQPDADFIPIVVFGKSAENCNKYIRKGSLVAVSGRLQSRNWDDQEGKRHFSLDVIADEVDFLDSKGSADARSQNIDSEFVEEDDFRPIDEDDDLPF